MLEYHHIGASMARWFSQLDPAAPGLHVRYRWIGRVLRLAGWLAGAPQPGPVHVPLDAPLPIAHWMSGVLRAGETPHLYTMPSCAVRLCEAACAAGIELRGAQFTLGGEPLTPARLAAVRKTGAEAVPRYGTSEAGTIGAGCLTPEVSDDLHLLDDKHALIQPGTNEPMSPLPPAALLISSLRPTAPVILLNVSLGDQGSLVRRSCGCPLEGHGWTRHLNTIRSFEKLTAGGVSFLDTDVTRVLEEVLPARFGGGPTDYQLVENETEDGRARLRLLIHPAIGPLDAEAVVEAFLTGIGPGTEGERLMAMQWRQMGLLRVDRRAPQTTATSKILHLHSEQSARPSRPSGSAVE